MTTDTATTDHESRPRRVNLRACHVERIRKERKHDGEGGAENLLQKAKKRAEKEKDKE